MNGLIKEFTKETGSTIIWMALVFIRGQMEENMKASI